MKAIITVGISCSGKSTLAKEYVDKGFIEINRDNIRFTEVMPGASWATYRFTKAREKRVTEIQHQQIFEAAKLGKIL